MQELTAEHFLSLFIVLISWILVLFLLTTKSKNKKSNLILALFFLVNAQDSSGLFAHFFLYPYYPGLGMLLNSTVFLKMPLLYLYLASVIYTDFKFHKKHLWHLVPFLINFIVLIPRFYFVDFESQQLFLRQEKNDMLEIQISYLLIHFQILVYLIFCFKLIFKYKKLLLENYSNASLFNYKWLFQFVLLFAIEGFIASFKNLFLFLKLELAFNISYYITSFSALFFMCWIVLKALQNPDLFRGVNSNLQLVRNIVLERIQLNDSKLVQDESDIEEIVLLKKFMINEEPFLEASLTINDLAEKINMPVKDLSVLINHNLNQHFFDFINGYRIRKAMGILKSPEKRELTVLEVLYEVGFNSKSSFNTAFKKYTNLTPTEFRNNNTKSIA